MRRWIALLAAAALVVGAAAVDPCKRQPFRGRCPSVNGQAPRRSQFVLRYYARNGECVSYPYGHCVQDDSEPQLYRYKEECEDHCLQAQEAPGNLGSPKDQGEETYGTIAPILERQPTHAAVNTELPPVVVEQAIEEVETTEEQKTSTTTTTTTTTTTSTASTTTKEPTTTTEKTTTTEEPSTESPSTTTDVTTESTTVSTPEIEATTTTTTTTTTATTTQSTTTKAVSTPDATSTTEHVKSHPRIIEGVKSGIRIQTSSQPTTTGPSTAAPRTECERRRAAAASSKIRGGFVPACESDGRFKKVQCEPDGRQCFCVGDNGIEIANSRTKNGLQPNCHMIETAPRPHIKECTGGFNGGPCSSAITRWYYSEQDQKCKKFTFSGCGGNGNNYESESECLQRCAPPSGLPRCEKGEPLKTTQGAPVNCAKQECPSGYRCSVVQHSSVCCPENNKIIGQQTSELAGVCRLSKEHGPCEKYELRFYYNADLNECKYFFYGGCDGNGNNFVTVEDCKRTCGIAQSGATRSPTPRTTQGIRITPEALTSSTTPEPSTEPSTSHQTQAATTRRTPQTVPTHPTTRRVTHSAPTTTTEEPTTHRRAETTRAEHRTAFNSHTSTQAPVIHIQQQRPFNVPPLPHGDLTPGSAEDMLPDSANRCSHPQDAGSCRGQFIRWYWDSEKKFCDVFTYSGCEGNGNNFASREECLALCHREVTQSVTPDFSNVCEHEVDAGECNGVFQRFAFDSEAGECRPFTYGGCGGNGNNFATMAECRAKCQRVSTQPINLCEHDIEAGECTGVFPRFGYDRETNDCRQFTYGGCGGNGNNFASMAECRNVCIKKACNPSPQCDLSRCQIVNDSTGCPFCSCAPIRQPIPSTQCPPVDVSRCQEPCMVINNRRGCQECACPKSPNSPIPPVLLPPQGHPEEAGPPASSRQSSSASRVVGPPAEPTHVAPPAPRAHAAEPIEPVHKIDLSKNDLERPQLPNKLNLDLQEKCFQPMEAGPCKNFVDRWYFNSEDGTCHPFKYGGCAGNRNHFFTQKECEIHCARFLRESSEQSEEDEPRLLSSHHRAAGVTQVKMSEPLPVENYNSPNPPLRSKAVAAAAPEAGRRPLVPLPLPPHGFEAFPPGFDRLITTQGVKITPRTSTTTTATTTTTTSTTTSTTSPTTSRQPVTTTKRDVFETEPTTDSTAVTESTTNVKQTSPVHDDVSSTDASLPTQPSHVPLSTILSASTSHDSLEEDGLFTEITDSNTPHSSESPSSTLVPPMETTLVNEVDDMGDDEHIENEVEDFEKKMKPSSKFNNQAVQRETEEEEIFDEAELTTVAVSTTVKADEVKAATLKKIEISRTTKAPTTREPSTSSTPSTSVDEEAQESEFAVSDDSDEEHEADADIEQTPEAPTKSLSTTNAPAQSDITTAYTTTEVEETPSTQVAESETTSVAAPITRFASSTSAENSSTTSETTTQPITDAKVAGITQFEPATEEEVIDVNSVGREPVPSSPVGIGRIAENLDIDDLGELEEPTTIVPTTQKTTATSTPAVTRISSKAPVTSATTAAGRITTVGLVNSASTHIVRHDVFDAQIICNQAPDVGLCRNFMTRWFYNAQTARCEQFSFGSCGGNLNNFADRETCELRCMSGGAQPVLQSQVPERCTFSSDSGFGKEYHPKWYFNMRNLRCERFVYFGQGGNVNHFETLGDCERVCTPQPIHSLTDEQTKNPNIIQTTNPTTRATAPTKATSASTKATQPTPPPRTLPPTPSTEAKTHSLRPLPEQSLPVPTIDDNAENIGDDVEYDSTELEDQNLLPQLPEETRALPTLATARPIAPIPPQELPGAAPPASEPRPPSANAAKTITQEEVEAESLKTTSQPKTTYKAEPLPAEGTPLSGEHLPIVAPSPKQQVDYQTGQRNIVHGISNFHDGRISASDILDVDEFDGKSNLPACPNNGKELRYTDGRPIMCLPGKNQCPDQSVCYFNGVDYFCCPTVEDPYDKHVFGGYGGEEVRNGYKVFGPLRVRRLMDDVPLREKRQTSMDRAFQTNPVSFNLDSVVAPLRFDAEKPRTVSRASRMRKPRPPHHGNPMCILPLVKGECKEAHLRYYYDVPSDSCRLFYYSGCQGNANNFGSLEDCQRLCVLANQPQTHIEAAAVVSSEPVLPPGKCPSGSPLGGASPVLCGNSTDSIGCPSGYYCRSGPPDICCPGEEPVATPGPVQQGVRSFPVSSSDRISVGTPRQYNKDALLSTPKDICPDASDPLIDENGQPLICGAGFDGMSMCPKGFYCAIDAEKNSRLCCPLYGAAQRIPTETVSAPYFGKRVVEKESMTTSEPVDSQEHEEFLDSEEEYEDEEDEDAPQHIMVKSDSRHQALQHAAASESPKAVSIENETVSIDVPTEAPAPEADETTSLKPTDDKSICQLKPTEGRPCRSDEKPPRTNLHFFYSAKDNRCKLYFYRGCGGNENRFEKKADCEARCLVRS